MWWELHKPMNDGHCILVGFLGVFAAIVAIVYISCWYNLETNKLFTQNGYVECTLQGSGITAWCKQPK